MKKETYFQTLYKLLRKLPENDRQTTVAFYREIVEDRMENGLSEEAQWQAWETSTSLPRKFCWKIHSGGPARNRYGLPWALRWLS